MISRQAKIGRTFKKLRLYVKFTLREPVDNWSNEKIRAVNKNDSWLAVQ